MAIEQSSIRLDPIVKATKQTFGQKRSVEDKTIRYRH
jgi:hypothetical protein